MGDSAAKLTFLGMNLLDKPKVPSLSFFGVDFLKLPILRIIPLIFKIIGLYIDEFKWYMENYIFLLMLLCCILFVLAKVGWSCSKNMITFGII